MKKSPLFRALTKPEPDFEEIEMESIDESEPMQGVGDAANKTSPDSVLVVGDSKAEDKDDPKTEDLVAQMKTLDLPKQEMHTAIATAVEAAGTKRSERRDGIFHSPWANESAEARGRMENQNMADRSDIDLRENKPPIHVRPTPPSLPCCKRSPDSGVRRDNAEVRLTASEDALAEDRPCACCPARPVGRPWAGVTEACFLSTFYSDLLARRPCLVFSEWSSRYDIFSLFMFQRARKDPCFECLGIGCF